MNHIISCQKEDRAKLLRQVSLNIFFVFSCIFLTFVVIGGAYATVMLVESVIKVLLPPQDFAGVLAPTPYRAWVEIGVGFIFLACGMLAILKSKMNNKTNDPAHRVPEKLTPLTIEYLYPLVLLILAGAGWFCWGTPIPHALSNTLLLSSVVTFSSIAAFSLLVVKLYLGFTLRNTAIGRQLERHRRHTFLFTYLQSAILSSFGLSIFCITVLFVFPGEEIPLFVAACFVGWTVFCMASVWRTYRILARMIQTSLALAAADELEG